MVSIFKAKIRPITGASEAASALVTRRGFSGRREGATCTSRRANEGQLKGGRDRLTSSPQRQRFRSIVAISALR